MIIKSKCHPDSDNAGKYDIQYYGKDAEKFLKSIDFKNDIKFLGKECITCNNKKGIIIGVEDSNTYMDYYYIVYIPSDKVTKFELVNSSEFVSTIKL